MKNLTKITRKDYMANSQELHHLFYSQFVTSQTKGFILRSLKVEDIKNAIDNGDTHLNGLKIPYNNMSRGGGWWWDDAPINTALLKELGESNTQSTCTCVAKAAARMLAAE